MLYVDNLDPVHLRELTPKDFYYAQLLRNKEESLLSIIDRLVLNPEVVDFMPARAFRVVITWMAENLIEENLLSVENWLEIGFHLCKQRWDESLDWLETQPMSKIHTMIQIVKNYSEEQEKQMKKSAKKK